MFESESTSALTSLHGRCFEVSPWSSDILGFAVSSNSKKSLLFYFPLAAQSKLYRLALPRRMCLMRRRRFGIHIHYGARSLFHQRIIIFYFCLTAQGKPYRLTLAPRMCLMRRRRLGILYPISELSHPKPNIFFQSHHIKSKAMKSQENSKLLNQAMLSHHTLEKL